MYLRQFASLHNKYFCISITPVSIMKPCKHIFLEWNISWKNTVLQFCNVGNMYSFWKCHVWDITLMLPWMQTWKLYQMHIKIWTGVFMCTYECTHPYILVEAVADISWCKYMWFLCQSTWASGHLTIQPCGHLAFRSGHVTAWPCGPCSHVTTWPCAHVTNWLSGLLII